MSNYGHYNHQYYGTREKKHPKSFKIAGISNYEDAKIIDYDTILEMEYEPNNPYDSSAIKIKVKDKMVGYVPNNPPNIKKMCFENINEKLKVINIKGNPRGVRVLFQFSKFIPVELQANECLWYKENSKLVTEKGYRMPKCYAAVASHDTIKIPSFNKMVFFDARQKFRKFHYVYIYIYSVFVFFFYSFFLTNNNKIQ